MVKWSLVTGYRHGLPSLQKGAKRLGGVDGGGDARRIKGYPYV
ncbi:MAG: hypothetical protein QM305_14050 [Bacteroidota bacterium]|nr:hypothetical protein [Bacteroidota bacterium]